MTTEMALENITTEVKNDVLLITINRPDKLNSLNKQTIEELHETFVEAENAAFPSLPINCFPLHNSRILKQFFLGVLKMPSKTPSASSSPMPSSPAG